VKQRILLLFALATVFGSCSVYKNGQTPDDVYYSPSKNMAGYVSTEEEKKQIPTIAICGGNPKTGPAGQHLTMTWPTGIILPGTIRCISAVSGILIIPAGMLALAILRAGTAMVTDGIPFTLDIMEALS
jgi:hypothetical protein